MDDTMINQYKKVIALPFYDEGVRNMFNTRLEEGNITRDENTQSHFCVYFAVTDSYAQEVFLGHHKKSGLWLFNGGHIDTNELPIDALMREMDEELGLRIVKARIEDPFLLTVTPILIPPNFPCKVHFDIWYLINVDKNTFNPDEEKLSKEFFSTQWMTIEQAKKYVDTANTYKALSLLQKRFISTQ